MEKLPLGPEKIEEKLFYIAGGIPITAVRQLSPVNNSNIGRLSSPKTIFFDKKGSLYIIDVDSEKKKTLTPVKDLPNPSPVWHFTIFTEENRDDDVGPVVVAGNDAGDIYTIKIEGTRPEISSSGKCMGMITHTERVTGVYNGVLITSTDGTCRIIAPQTGDLIWGYAGAGPLITAASGTLEDKDYLILGDGIGKLYIFKDYSEYPVRTLKLPAGIRAISADFTEGILMIGCDNMKLYLYRLEDGEKYTDSALAINAYIWQLYGIRIESEIFGLVGGYSFNFMGDLIEDNTRPVLILLKIGKEGRKIITEEKIRVDGLNAHSISITDDRKHPPLIMAGTTDGRVLVMDISLKPEELINTGAFINSVDISRSEKGANAGIYTAIFGDDAGNLGFYKLRKPRKNKIRDNT